ncbi:hypothetical protein D9758_018714 [Tetrapyrgos nigripes]|uniref:Protein kinase domain-containing protein n=1 Tax=Tetrapyrgos nigripes TaxID=182062 RepID=A0A8H5EVD4_9AGAR|nr:hypothetical protein D9758_018714 [Tetrapyrgos nigripes]
MYQNPQQYQQYPSGFGHPNFLHQYPPNVQSTQALQPAGSYVPPPQNYYAFTRETLIQVLEKLSELVEAEFRGLPIRLIVHGGACVLLHSGLHEIADRRATHSGFLVETQRFTTRDVDYIHRSFVAEYETQGVLNPGERLKRCIHETAVQMGHNFSLGVDWMNSDADAGLPVHKDLRTGRITDPVYMASIKPDNIRRNAVFISSNNKLTIVSIPAAWAVALKIHRYSLKDSSDICLFLILESRNRSTPWSVESVKQWLESECSDMNYKNFDRYRLIQRRERLKDVLAVLATTNNRALEYNIDQVQAFLPDGKTGIQPPGSSPPLPDPRPVSTDRFQIGTVPHLVTGWHPNPSNLDLSSRSAATRDHRDRHVHHRSSHEHNAQLYSRDFFVPPDIGSASGHRSASRDSEGRGTSVHRYQLAHEASNDSSPDDEDSSDDLSDAEEDTEEDSTGDDINRRHPVPSLYRNTATPGSSTRRNVTIWEPPPEILSVEEVAVKHMSSLVIHNRPATPYQLDESAQIHRSPHGLLRQPTAPERHSSMPLQQAHTYAQYAEKVNPGSAYSNPIDVFSDSHPKSPMSDVAFIAHKGRAPLNWARHNASPSRVSAIDSTRALTGDDSSISHSDSNPRQAMASTVTTILSTHLGSVNSEDVDGEGLISADTVIKRLESMIGDRNEYQRLLEQQGTLAQSLLDLLQTLCDYPDVEKRLRSKFSTAMLRLSKNSGLYPSCLTLNNVQKIGDHPVTAGGFGEIWKGLLGGEVSCLKVVKIYGDSEVQKLMKEFLKEAIVWRQLDHPNVLPFLGIYFLDTSKQRICLISPWMDNGNLNHYLADGSHGYADRLTLAYDVACGLAYLHGEKIIHGDLKGVNILITARRRATIADFGLSRVIESEAFTMTSRSSRVVQGTARWLAPECLMKNQRASYQSDVYAFGCIFTGQLPFHHCQNDAAIVFQLIKGNRPIRPPNELWVNDEVWAIMEDCWDEEASARPLADTLPDRFEDGKEIATADRWVYPLPPHFWNDIRHPELCPTGSELETFLKPFYSRTLPPEIFLADATMQSTVPA